MSTPHTTHDIREAFVRYFEERGHRQLESASLVPIDDPTLLFTNAGMVPFKSFFMGRATPPALRLTTVQRCFRAIDLENVGDATHHTFFEMLGNFSLGDYFKKEAIEWAWDFCTGVLALPAERLWTTIYTDDDEAYELWRAIGRPDDRILRYGKEDGNFWDTGAGVGPCGPCSELHYDYGEEYGCGPECEPKHDCGRFLEIWNLVFMTYMQHEDGSLTDLPKKNIDTGAGLERVTMAVQQVRSSYETDGLRPLLDAAASMADRRYGEDVQADFALRAIVDHSRALAFLIADGVLPSNEGRGYILRRLLRRAVYFGRSLKMPVGFMDHMAAEVLDELGPGHPFLQERERLIRATVAREETKFRETLENGLTRLDELLASLEGQGDAIPGEEVFRLYETYGLPKELTAEVARAHGLTIDDAGYERAREEAREQARRAGRDLFLQGRDVLDSAFTRLVGHGEHFSGYDRTTAVSHVTGIIHGTTLVEQAHEGEDVLVILDDTPFYPEGGGQVGDAGSIVSDPGRFQVTDTKRHASGVIYHIGRVTAGALSVNDQVQAEVDPARRQDSARNHTGTHLLHAALRSVLGDHLHQRGSLVAPERLRFDYNHPEAPNPDELTWARMLVNDRVRADVSVTAREASLEQARAEGVTAIFGEKYGDRVRVVEIDGGGAGRPFSAELCGGTHVHETGEIGGLFIVSEGSIGSGLRRIEALTGATAERWVTEQIGILDSATRRIGGSPAELEQRIAHLQDELAAERRRAEALRREADRRQASGLTDRAETVNDARLLVAQVEAEGIEALKQMGDEVKRALGPSVVVLGAVTGDRTSIFVTKRDIDGRVHAGNLVKQLLDVAGAKGGGSADSAQCFGTDPAKLSSALDVARSLAREQLARGSG